MNKLTQEEIQKLMDILTSHDNARLLHYQALRNPSKDDQIKNMVKGGQLLKIGLKLIGHWDKDDSKLD